MDKRHAWRASPGEGIISSNAYKWACLKVTGTIISCSQLSHQNISEPDWSCNGHAMCLFGVQQSLRDTPLIC